MNAFNYEVCVDFQLIPFVTGVRNEMLGLA